MPTGDALAAITRGVLTGAPSSTVVTLPVGTGPTFDEAVAGFAAVAHTVKLNRWAQAFKDLGNVDPRLALDLALALLPGLERGRTGIGQLLGAVTAQYARAQAEGWAPLLGEELVGWLALFRGTSQTARYARTLKEKGQ